MDEYFHIPVFGESILNYLDIKASDVVLDCTCGEGGHSSIILERVKENGFLICLDRDEEIIAIARERLLKVSKNFLLLNLSFSSAKEALAVSNLAGFDKILVDLGLSMYHIAKKERGFSFLSDEPCDMRYDRKKTNLTASFILKNYSEEEISDIIYTYGEERMARRIAHAIVTERKKKPIESCKELSHIVARIYKSRGRINPATKTFQALRIYVNSELSELKRFFSILPEIINPGGVVGIISYHSLEDRIVKNFFKTSEHFRSLSKKVITPDKGEVAFNKAVRSAKLRIGMRL